MSKYKVCGLEKLNKVYMWTSSLCEFDCNSIYFYLFINLNLFRLIDYYVCSQVSPSHTASQRFWHPFKMILAKWKFFTYTALFFLFFSIINVPFCANMHRMKENNTRSLTLRIKWTSLFTETIIGEKKKNQRKLSLCQHLSLNRGLKPDIFWTF